MEGEEERVMNVGGDWLVFVVTWGGSAEGDKIDRLNCDKMGRRCGEVAGVNCRRETAVSHLL